MDHNLSLVPASSAVTSVRANCQLTGFNPTEAAEITGVSRVVQSQWKHRGHLPETPKHQVVYTVFSLARLLCLRLFGQCRHDHNVLHAVAEAAGNAIAWRALGWENSWGGDHRRIGTWDSDWVEQARAREDRGWHWQANLLRQMVFEARGVTPATEQFCILWADNTFSFTNDLNGEVSRVAGTSRTKTKMFAIDLAHAGYTLTESASREFAYVELEME